MKAITITLLSALCIFVVLSLLDWIGLLPKDWTILVGDFSAEVRISLIYGLGAIVVLLVIFLFAIVHLPAKIHNEQVEEISALRGTNSIVKLSMTPYNQPRSPKSPSYQQASLYITNNESVELTECVGTLNSLIYRWPNGTETDYQDLIVLPRYFAWSSRSRLGDRHAVTIRPGANHRAILDIAGASNGEMKFNFVEGNENAQGIGRYFVEVAISGKKSGVSFEATAHQFYLEFTGGESLMIKNFAEEDARVKE